MTRHSDDLVVGLANRQPQRLEKTLESVARIRVRDRKEPGELAFDGVASDGVAERAGVGHTLCHSVADRKIKAGVEKYRILGEGDAGDLESDASRGEGERLARYVERLVSAWNLLNLPGHWVRA